MYGKDEKPKGTVFKAGAVSLAFLIIGYEAAVFVHRATEERIAAARDHPDTVFISPSAAPVRHDAAHSPYVQASRERTRRVESFRFNPNTASVEELQRLGFSAKQAQSIDNYRKKGGRFRRKEDFAKSYVVADSVFRRLSPYIDIPRTDINTADSAAFDALPGIGGYFAAKMVSYRHALGGYSYPEQLMDIWHFDKEKYDALSDLIFCSAPKDSFDLWGLPADSLQLHPYIRSYQAARGIVFFRDHNPPQEWSVAALGKSGILAEEDAARLARCAIKSHQ